MTRATVAERCTLVFEARVDAGAMVQLRPARATLCGRKVSLKKVKWFKAEEVVVDRPARFQIRDFVCRPFRPPVRGGASVVSQFSTCAVEAGGFPATDFSADKSFWDRQVLFDTCAGCDLAIFVENRGRCRRSFLVRVVGRAVRA